MSPDHPGCARRRSAPAARQSSPESEHDGPFAWLAMRVHAMQDHSRGEPLEHAAKRERLVEPTPDQRALARVDNRNPESALRPAFEPRPAGSRDAIDAALGRDGDGRGEQRCTVAVNVASVHSSGLARGSCAATSARCGSIVCVASRDGFAAKSCANQRARNLTVYAARSGPENQRSQDRCRSRGSPTRSVPYRKSEPLPREHRA